MLNHKREEMRAAKLIIGLFYLSTISFLSAQDVEETYFWKDALGTESKLLSLHQDNTFVYETEGDMDIKEISKGYYVIKKDTLVLMHSPLQDPFPSKFQIIEQDSETKPEFGESRKLPEDLALMMLEILDKNERAIQNCDVALKRGESIVSGETSNADGIVKISTEGKVIDTILVFNLGYKLLKIGMEPFWGKNSKIKVILSDSNRIYNNKSYIEKYIVEYSNGKIAKLRSIDGNYTYILPN